MLYRDLDDDDYTAIFDGDLEHKASEEFPFYPLTAPGMPPAGPNFVARAEDLTKDEGNVERMGWWVNKLYHMALYSSVTLRASTPSGQDFDVETIPGHLWHGAAGGPVVPYQEEGVKKKPTVMIVGKNPGKEEANDKRVLCGPSGDHLHKSLREVGADEEEFGRWYVTNLVRWVMPQSINSVPNKWIKDCLPLLHQEIRLVQPDYILCLGAEATKAVCGPGHSVGNMIGRSIDLKIPMHELGEEEDLHTAKVMAVVHPAAVLRTPELQPQLLSVLKNFVELVRGKEFSKTHSDAAVEIITDVQQLKKVVDGILAQPGLLKVALDAEWHGQHAGEPGSYLRSIQFCADGKRAYVISLLGPGGTPRFKPSIAAAAEQLNRLFEYDTLIIGHFFFSDLPWLAYNGIDLLDKFTIPATYAECNHGEYVGGFDTAMAAHAHNETDLLKLEVQASRYCGAPRWDIEMQKWKDEYCSKHGLKDEELEGYGECPDEVLLPYSGYDVIYSWRLYQAYAKRGGMLDKDKFGNSSWEPFITTMGAFPAIVEINTSGVLVDKDRVNDLTDLFMVARDNALNKLREELKWPEFNQRSHQQCTEMLFGEEYSTKRDKVTGKRVSVRPKGARALYLTPIKTTGQRPKLWSRIVQAKETDLYNPSTDKEVCGILGMRNKTALRLRDVRMLDHVMKGVFCLPEYDKEGKLVKDELGNRIYKGGILSHVCHDGRVRTTILPTAETGRGKSRRPNLQNLAARRERDYRRLLDEIYTHKIRSFCMASPGMVLLEADYTGAELMIMAVMSRDEKMIEHCMRANLPDGHPNYYNIHSNIAVSTFGLNCEPTKSALYEAGYDGLYVGSKNIIFG